MPTPPEILQLVESQAAQTEKLSQIAATVDKISTTLHGNGKEGLIVRTDRLEQRAKIRARASWVLFSLVAAALIKPVLFLFGIAND